MTIEKARYWAENMAELSKNDRLWLNNPVVMQGVGLAPMVVAATSGYTALVLAAAVAVMLTPTRVGGAILRKALGEKYNRFAVLCYAFPAALCYIAAYFLVRHLWGPSALQQVGVYLPLLVFEPLIIRRYRAAVPEGPARALRRGPGQPDGRAVAGRAAVPAGGPAGRRLYAAGRGVRRLARPGACL